MPATLSLFYLLHCYLCVVYSQTFVAKVVLQYMCMPKKLARLDAAGSATCADTASVFLVLWSFFFFFFFNIYRMHYFGNNTTLYLILSLIAIVSFSHDKDLVWKQQSNLHLFILY